MGPLQGLKVIEFAGIGPGPFAAMLFADMGATVAVSYTHLESGKQARVINQIVQTFFSGHPLTEDELKELIGHTTLQVIVGGLIGIFYSLIFLLARDWF